MKNNFPIDPLIVGDAEIELLRLSQGQSIDWGSVKAFRGILAKMHEDVNNKQTQTFLVEVLSEFHTKHPCRRRMDDLTSKGILDELDWLINGRSPIRCRAERLYGFCHLFSKHIDTKRGVILSVPQTAAFL